MCVWARGSRGPIGVGANHYAPLTEEVPYSLGAKVIGLKALRPSGHAAGIESAEASLHDNATEAGFEVLRRRNRRRIVGSSLVLIIAIIVTGVFMPAALASPTSSLALAWFAAVGFFSVILIAGLLAERNGLRVRVTESGISLHHARWISASLLGGARLTESNRWIEVRREKAGKNLLVLTISKRRSANPIRFKEAIESLVTRSRTP